MGKISSGLFVLTAVLDGKRAGMLCSFVEQAGFEPPMVTVAMGMDRPILAAMVEDVVFGLNILGKDDGGLMKPFMKDADPFAGLETDESVPGAIRLTSAFAFLACRVRARCEGGDHVVVLAEVIDGAGGVEGEPMVRVRRDGFGY